jgi:SAM-dependent methyltransferase
VGADGVSAIDPSEPFVAAVAVRHPGIAALHASAEDLPFADGQFDAVLAQLVVHFMTDPIAGLTEMARVTRSGGVVATCVWDFAGGRAPLSDFWAAARELDPGADDESHLAGVREGQLVALMTAAGLRDVTEATLSVSLEHPTFDAWWAPYMGGVGPAGSFIARLRSDRQVELRELCRARLPMAPFVQTASAWAARGLA